MPQARLEKDGSVTLKVGVFALRGCRLETRLAGRPHDPPWRRSSVKTTANGLVAKFAHPHWSGLTTELTVKQVSSAGPTIRRTLTNRTGQEIRLDTARLFRGQDTLLVRTGTVAAGETIYLGATTTAEVPVAVAEYKSLLRKAIPERTDAMRKLPFKDSRFWDSWNMGLYRNISHGLDRQPGPDHRQDPSGPQVDLG